MIRRHIWMLACVCCSGVVAIAPLRAENATTGQICLYQSRSYSEGAYVCVRKSLMLNCWSDGTKATWKIVADSDLNARCAAPTALNYPSESRPHAHRRHAIRYRAGTVAEGSAKCFVFNGRQYCE